MTMKVSGHYALQIWRTSDDLKTYGVLMHLPTGRAVFSCSRPTLWELLAAMADYTREEGVT